MFGLCRKELSVMQKRNKLEKKGKKVDICRTMYRESDYFINDWKKTQTYYKLEHINFKYNH